MYLAEGSMGIHPNIHFTYHLPRPLCAEKRDEVLQIVCMYYPYPNIGTIVNPLAPDFFF